MVGRVAAERWDNAAVARGDRQLSAELVERNLPISLADELLFSLLTEDSSADTTHPLHASNAYCKLDTMTYVQVTTILPNWSAASSRSYAALPSAAG